MSPILVLAKGVPSSLDAFVALQKMITPEPRHILKIPSLTSYLDFFSYCTFIKVLLVPTGVYLILVVCSSAGGFSPNETVLKKYSPSRYLGM